VDPTVADMESINGLECGSDPHFAPLVDEWLTRLEVAERLKVRKSTLDQWAHHGVGPRYARFGRHVRYRLSDVIAWENAQFTDGDAA
jgi:excisionase family DNA binding protein